MIDAQSWGAYASRVWHSASRRMLLHTAQIWQVALPPHPIIHNHNLKFVLKKIKVNLSKLSHFDSPRVPTPKTGSFHCQSVSQTVAIASLPLIQNPKLNPQNYCNLPQKNRIFLAPSIDCGLRTEDIGLGLARRSATKAAGWPQAQLPSQSALSRDSSASLSAIARRATAEALAKAGPSHTSHFLSSSNSTLTIQNLKMS